MMWYCGADCDWCCRGSDRWGRGGGYVCKRLCRIDADVDAFVHLRESDADVAARLRPRSEAGSDSEELELEDADDDEDDEDDEEAFTGDRRWRGEESMTLFPLDGRSLETAGGEAGIE